MYDYIKRYKKYIYTVKHSSFQPIIECIMQELYRIHTEIIQKTGVTLQLTLGASMQMRIVPLSKARRPQLPDPRDIRPLTIMSPILKLMEARFLPSLKQYGCEKLFKGQVGFVKGLDTGVNIWRICHIMDNSQKKNRFLLFIDSYNTISREKLWKYLENVLQPEEILHRNFMKQSVLRLINLNLSLTKV